MNFFVSKTFLILSVSCCVQLLGSELTKWTFPVDVQTDEDRREYFIEKIKKNMIGDRSPDIVFHMGHEAGADNCRQFGYNIVYHGPIEKFAYGIMANLDFHNKEAIVLGGGTCRTAIDILQKTHNTHVVANDISRAQLTTLATAIVTLQIPSERLSIICGDAEKLVQKRPDNSVDYYYATNLIHFFRFAKIKSLLTDIQRTLKSGGILFLSWTGYDPYGNYSQFTSHIWSQEKHYLENQNIINNPELIYIEETGNSRPTIKNIQDLANQLGMSVLNARHLWPTSARVTLRGKQIDCDYKFDEFDNGKARDGFPCCQVILGKPYILPN